MADKDFAYWWNVPGEWVEPPNERRNGWSGMMRAPVDGRTLYVKRQLNHMCRSLAHPFGWPTTSREWHNLQRLAGLGIAAPVPLFHAVRDTDAGTEAVLVTEELTGFADLAAFEHLGDAEKSALAGAVGDMLGRLHLARLQHSSLYDKHVFVRQRPDGFDVALIDLEKMRRRLTVGMAAKHDLEQLRRRQKVFGDAHWADLLAAHGRSFSGAGA